MVRKRLARVEAKRRKAAEDSVGFYESHTLALLERANKQCQEYEYTAESEECQDYRKRPNTTSLPIYYELLKVLKAVK